MCFVHATKFQLTIKATATLFPSATAFSITIAVFARQRVTTLRMSTLRLIRTESRENEFRQGRNIHCSFFFLSYLAAPVNVVVVVVAARCRWSETRAKEIDNRRD